MAATLAPIGILLLCSCAVVITLARGRATRTMVRAASLCQAAALSLALVDAGRVLWWGEALHAGLSSPLGPLAGALTLDALAAIFVVALGTVGIAIAAYAPSYLSHAAHRMAAPTQQALLCLLEATMLAVLIASDVVGFFVAWEMMTAIATALVLADGHRAEVKRAAILYLVVNHIGTLAALAGMLLLAGDGGLSFEALRAGAARSDGAATAGIALALVGFSAKAGVVPLHVWLPEAHPAAPSHVSALLSGVILKIGVYAMLRVALDLGGRPPAWVGYVLLVAGVASALLGVLYALMQHDMKRLLAFHSVENIGIILLGVGLGVVALDAGMPALGSLALAAGLFHVVNHAVFKALLFLCAGSVHSGAHTHDLEELGGLATLMPSTSRSFLLGALAISALPPLNGFASEWLIVEAFIGATGAPSDLLRAVAPLFCAALALTGALAAACFVKAFAVAFLALPRSEHAARAVEAPPWCRGAQNALAAMCVVLGCASPWVIFFASRAGAGLGPWPLLPWRASLGGDGVGVSSPIALLLVGLLVGGGLLTALRRRRARRAQTWACGLGTVDGRAAYTASAFANPIRRIFAGLYQFERATEPVAGTAPYFVTVSRTRGAMAPLFERYLYQPAIRALHLVADRITPWIPPTVNRGLILFALTLFVLLLWASS